MIAAMLGLMLSLQPGQQRTPPRLDESSIPPSMFACAKGDSYRSPGYDGMFGVFVQHDKARDIIHLQHIFNGKTEEASLHGAVKSVTVEGDRKASLLLVKAQGQADGKPVQLELAIHQGTDIASSVELKLVWNGVSRAETCHFAPLPAPDRFQ